MIKIIGSHLEEKLLLHIKASKLPLPVREYKFCPGRRYRSDFVWPDHKLIVEVEGGIYTRGRHTRPLGYMKDCEKYNCAVLMGFKVIRVTSDHIDNGMAIDWIIEGLNYDKGDL